MKTLLLLLTLVSLNLEGKVSYEGVLEIETAYQNEPKDKFELTEPTIEMATEIEISENWKATIAFLHEEGTNFDVEEAFISFKKGNFNLNAGKMILPLLNLESNLISDPLTLELFEQHEQMVTSQITWNKIFLTLGTFKSRHDNDKLRSFLAGVGYNLGAIKVMAHYISNISSSNTLAGQANLAECAALAFSLNMNYGQLAFIAESVTATDYIINGKRPLAYQFELSYNLKSFTPTLGFQGSQDSFGLPVTRILAGIELPINDKVTTKIEYAKDNSLQDVKSDTVTAQLALNF